MTNILAAIIVTVATNWTSIGTFTPKNGWQSEDMQSGQVTTNTTAIFEWKGQRREFVLESVPGPCVGERRVPTVLTNWAIGRSVDITNIVFTNWPRWWSVSNLAKEAIPL